MALHLHHACTLSHGRLDGLVGNLDDRISGIRDSNRLSRLVVSPKQSIQLGDRDYVVIIKGSVQIKWTMGGRLEAHGVYSSLR